MTESIGNVDGAKTGMNRRAAIAKGVTAATAAGVVWSAPRIEGLSLRPNYAAAQSGPQMLATTVNRSTSGDITTATAMCPQGNMTLQAQFAGGFVTGRASLMPLNAGTITAINIAPASIVPTANDISAGGGSAQTGGPASSAGDATITVSYNCA